MITYFSNKNFSNKIKIIIIFVVNFNDIIQKEEHIELIK